LQAATLDKIHEYERDVKNLGSEMQALQGAFSKVVSPLVGSVKELKEMREIKKRKKITKKRKTKPLRH